MHARTTLRYNEGTGIAYTIWGKRLNRLVVSWDGQNPRVHTSAPKVYDVRGNSRKVQKTLLPHTPKEKRRRRVCSRINTNQASRKRIRRSLLQVLIYLDAFHDGTVRHLSGVRDSQPIATAPSRAAPREHLLPIHCQGRPRREGKSMESGRSC